LKFEFTLALTPALSPEKRVGESTRFEELCVVVAITVVGPFDREAEE
jgi:hypothetical protein